MKTRAILYYITLLAYTLSLAHSVIPHHHHDSAEEARSHTHTDGPENDHDHHHTNVEHRHDKEHQHHNDDKSDEHSEETGHLLFFTHDANADVLFNHGTLDKPIKAKKIYIAIPAEARLSSFEISNHLVYHPPQCVSLSSRNATSSRSLRAPPFFIA